MKLIAVKRISERRPVGCVFEEPNPRAKMLVAIGLAKAYVEPTIAEELTRLKVGLSASSDHETARAVMSAAAEVVNEAPDLSTTETRRALHPSRRMRGRQA